MDNTPPPLPSWVDDPSLLPASPPPNPFTADNDPGEPQHLPRRCPRVAIADDECALLTALATNRRCLEIGTGLGRSTAVLNRAATYVVTIDPDPWVHENVWPGLRSCWSNVSCRPSLDDLLAYGLGGVIVDRHFELVFIDGDHSTPAVRHDLERVIPLCRSHALIILHDWTYLRSVRVGAAQALHAMRSTSARYSTYIPTSYGLGVILA